MVTRLLVHDSSASAPPLEILYEGTYLHDRIVIRVLGPLASTPRLSSMMVNDALLHKHQQATVPLQPRLQVYYKHYQ